MSYVIVAGVNLLIGILLLISLTRLANKHNAPKRKRIMVAVTIISFVVLMISVFMLAFRVGDKNLPVKASPTLFTIPIGPGIPINKSLVVILCITAAVLVLSLLFRYVAFPKFDEKRPKSNFQSLMEVITEWFEKRRKVILVTGTIILSFIFVTNLLKAIFGGQKMELEVSILSPMIPIGDAFQVSQSTVVMLAITGVILVLALLFRFVAFPRFNKEKPTSGFQNAIEAIIEWFSGYSQKTSELHSSFLSGYMFTMGIFMIMCSICEMLGVRSPTSDLIVTGAMALVTFVLINAYGIKKKGVWGRVKSLAEPTPIVFPFEIIGMVATPVSLACRLFGNILGGLIIMDLIYYALGAASVGIPAVVGLYFNVFHPLIQAYIFITLSLTFIREAVE